MEIALLKYPLVLKLNQILQLYFQKIPHMIKKVSLNVDRRKDLKLNYSNFLMTMFVINAHCNLFGIHQLENYIHARMLLLMEAKVNKLI
jgi:hypothetical protein